MRTTLTKSNGDNMKKLTYFSTLLAGLMGVTNAASHADPEGTSGGLQLGGSPNTVPSSDDEGKTEALITPTHGSDDGSEDGSEDGTASNSSTAAPVGCSFQVDATFGKNITTAIEALQVILAHTKKSEETDGSAAHKAVLMLASMGIDALNLKAPTTETEEAEPAVAVAAEEEEEEEEDGMGIPTESTLH